ncbi:Hypp624 [Branchiostoma lanceolatum]|uniref:Hypp624 protein n=1 Tax=Branchiostoma lanceolatum TaxID=7740 RepID=A0A8J9VBL3_BRALA|nr:Hypp624 [Branchiostoma lanceolatum]
MSAVRCNVPGCSSNLRRGDLPHHLATYQEAHLRQVSSLARQMKRQLAGAEWTGEQRLTPVKARGLTISSSNWTIEAFQEKVGRGQKLFVSPTFRRFEGNWRMVMEKKERWVLGLQLLSRLEAILLRFKIAILPPPNTDAEIMATGREGVMMTEGSAKGLQVNMSQEDLEAFTMEDGSLCIQVFLQEVDVV